MGCNNYNRNFQQGYQNRNTRNMPMQNMTSCNQMGARGGSNMNMRSEAPCKCEHHHHDCENNGRKDGCDIGKEHVDKMMPGMAFVPWQKWEEIYDMEKAFCAGTIFCQLDKPYVGRGK